MTARELPPFTLPSGQRVAIAAREEASPRSRAEGAPLFSEVLGLFDDGAVELRSEGGARIDVRDLPLGDFHALAALLGWAGHVEDPLVPVTCLNCDAPTEIAPARLLEISPFVDGELDDDVLDRTEPFGEELEIAPVPIGRVRLARRVVLSPRDVRTAEPLFSWAIRPESGLDAAIVRALGVVRLGDVTSAARVAGALSACDADARRDFAAAWHATHYPTRLVGARACEACGARVEVDAPYDRELTRWLDAPREARPAAGFPDVEPFAERAMELADALVGDLPDAAAHVAVVVEEGTPEVDEGGTPLLGGYLPPAASSHGTVSVYYRTFRAMWDEEGPYDWEAELAETIEHELEHHLSFLRGHDEVDDEERALIRDEAARVVGRKETARRARSTGGVREVLARTWPLWLLLGAATAYTCLVDR